MTLEFGFNEIEIDALESPSVEAVWTYFNSFGSQHYIVPDGRADLIFTFYIKANGCLTNIRPIISPAFTKAHSINIAPYQGFIGLRLRAGLAGSILQVPLPLITGRIQYDSHVMGYVPWVEKICDDKRSIKHLIIEINRHVIAAVPQFNSSMIGEALSLMAHGHGTMAISDIACELAVSERTINRHFTQAIGLSPKQYSSILRVKNVIIQLTTPHYTISDIALNCGFSDQSHMTRDIKNHMGKTPIHLRKILTTELFF